MTAGSCCVSKEKGVSEMLCNRVDIIHNINPEACSTVIRIHLSGKLGKITFVSVK